VRIKFFKSKSGTTLIEVMIAVIIIAIVMLGGGMFFFYGRVQIVREAHRRAATLVASGRVEELKAKDYGEINIGTEEINIDVDNLSKDSAIPPTMVTETVYVDDPEDGIGEANDPDGIDDYKKVTVTVEWRNGITKTVSVDTLIAPR